jgi:hypothetical protein
MNSLTEAEVAHRCGLRRFPSRKGQLPRAKRKAKDGPGEPIHCGGPALAFQPASDPVDLTPNTGEWADLKELWRPVVAIAGWEEEAGSWGKEGLCKLVQPVLKRSTAVCCDFVVTQPSSTSCASCTKQANPEWLRKIHTVQHCCGAFQQIGKVNVETSETVVGIEHLVC